MSLRPGFANVYLSILLQMMIPLYEIAAQLAEMNQRERAKLDADIAQDLARGKP